MTGKRKRYGAEFKSRVALEALRGELTAAQLAAKHGVHNTDQGSRFTSPRFTGVLLAAGVRVSMDGRGRWMDDGSLNACGAA